MFKQVIVVRKDLRLSRGKLAAQVAHASLDAYKMASPSARAGWEDEGGKKVVLEVPGLREILELKRKAGSMKLPLALVRDAGRTEIPAGTATALGIGPADEAAIDRVTGNLKML
jgi:PTH2 family peptidyl-tRNA hydrolase